MPLIYLNISDTPENTNGNSQFLKLYRKMIFPVVLLSCIIAATCQDSCPPSENINPCTCLKSEITCQNINSSDQLTKVVKNMNGYTIQNFELKDSNIGILPSDVFSGMTIYSLKISQSNLTQLGDSRNRPPFLGLEDSLQVLEIKQAFLDSNMPLVRLSLSHLKKLHRIISDENIMPTIGNNWFENGPYDLRQLLLTNTQTSVIGSHAFEALENLEYFSLNGGLEPEFKREMFPIPATFLLSMDLQNNKLTTLPSDIFSKMPSLEQVFLDSNRFTTIDEIIFVQVWSQLEYVYFHGNPINCNSNMKWIYKYRLPEHFGGYCTAPEKLLHKDLRNITLSDLE